MPSINAGDFKKGIKVLVDGQPHEMIECNFNKPGKGQAMYKTRLRNLLNGKILDITYRSGDSLESAEGFQVKRLTVLPGAVLSLQMHHHRAEHWVVVAGIARITLGEKVFDLAKNEHTFIPIGATHRIENPGDEPVHIIEVQVGDYLGEDDIVRFEDKYGREGRTD